MLDLIETLVDGTAGRYEGDEDLCGPADELLGVIIGRNVEEPEPPVDIVNVRVGAVPVNAKRLGIEALGGQRIGVAGQAPHDATTGNKHPHEDGRRRKRATPSLAVASQRVRP